MKYNIIEVYQGEVIDDENDLSLNQLCHMCRMKPAMIVEMVDEGILDPSGRGVKSWRFSYTTVDRILKVRRLQNDLKVNLAGAALALHLLEMIEQLEAENQRMQKTSV